MRLPDVRQHTDYACGAAALQAVLAFYEIDVRGDVLMADLRIAAVIPQRADEKRRRKRGRPLNFDPATYRRRNAAERCVGWLKECRGVATRFEKLAVNFLATVKLACVRLLLRRLRPSDRT